MVKSAYYALRTTLAMVKHFWKVCSLNELGSFRKLLNKMKFIEQKQTKVQNSRTATGSKYE